MSYLVSAFDMASFKFGYAVGQYPERTISAPIKVETKPENKGGYPNETRAWKVADHALSLLARDKPKAVVIEDNRIRFERRNLEGEIQAKSHGLQDYFLFHNFGIVSFYLHKKGIPLLWVKNSQVKSVCMNNGKASKQEVRHYTEFKYGIVAPDDDMSDAALLLDYYFVTH
jgi:Holliday junction resolvasome RuvABC endonuclease subunit